MLFAICTASAWALAIAPSAGSAVTAAGAFTPEANAAVGAISDVPAIAYRANDLGAMDPHERLKVTIWLKMRDKAAFDERVAALYTPDSPTYQKWLSTDDLLAYAPTAAERNTVKEVLEKAGLVVMSDAANPFALRAEGTANQMETAFATEIHNFKQQGRLIHANVREAHIAGDAGALVLSVSGLDNVPMKPATAQLRSPHTGKPLAMLPLAQVKAASTGLSAFFTDKCFQPARTYTFGKQGTLPIGVFYGNVYNQGSLSCAYNAAQMQTAYGLPAVYKAGLRGAGQTIVIVDPYGSQTLESDANQFNTLNDLPALNASNFTVLYPEGQPFDPILGEGWVGETSMDVEWAHAIAPSANIVLLALAAEDDQEFQLAIAYATLHKLGGVISNSYGAPEVEHGSVTLRAYNQVIEQAAAVGIAVNYASGDQSDLGMGTPVGAVLTPADSPYATAVGGTSLGIPTGAGGTKEVGWGNNQTVIASDLMNVSDPPQNDGNVEGAGGGSSMYFPKPVWQGKMPGSFRQVPDIALDADPYTAAVVIYTDPVFGPVIESMGGTSLACPMFSAFWALASEKAGHPLGQAAPMFGRLPANAIKDIVPVSSSTNVVGTVVDRASATYYSAAQLAAPLEDTQHFTSAIWPVEGLFVNLTFGTDSALRTTTGWDNVTGYGTPNGLEFINAAAKQ